MAKKTRLELQIEASMKRIQQEQAHLKDLENKQKTVDDDARNHRLCKRHGLLESFLPITIDFTDEQYEKFVKQHITNKHGIAALANITGQTVEAVYAAIEEAKEIKRNKKSIPAKAAATTVTADEKTATTATAAEQKPNTQPPKQSTSNPTNPVNPQGGKA
ncbi:MAG: DUF3847 domain-containing protein [Defluviitaleaceae bacterium]|nr:DUF3847 domain-containing protein [Defluviitaleaceae bacterium]